MDYTELSELCHLLASRKDPALKKHTKDTWLNLVDNRFYCLICGKDICYLDSTGVDYISLQNHGMSHLKEHNLTAFI